MCSEQETWGNMHDAYLLALPTSIENSCERRSVSSVAWVRKFQNLSKLKIDKKQKFILFCHSWRYIGRLLTYIWSLTPIISNHNAIGLGRQICGLAERVTAFAALQKCIFSMFSLWVARRESGPMVFSADLDIQLNNTFYGHIKRVGPFSFRAIRRENSKKMHFWRVGKAVTSSARSQICCPSLMTLWLDIMGVKLQM